MPERLKNLISWMYSPVAQAALAECAEQERERQSSD